MFQVSFTPLGEAVPLPLSRLKVGGKFTATHSLGPRAGLDLGAEDDMRFSRFQTFAVI